MTDAFEAWWTRFTKGSISMQQNLGLKEVARAAWEASRDYEKNARKLVH